MDLETAADELYGGDPDEFVPTRTRLVQQMTLPWFQASVNERGGGVQPDLWDR